MEKTSDSDLIYSVYNHVIASGDVLLTNTPIWKSGQDLTILFDFQQTSNPTGASDYGRTYRLLYFKNTPADVTGLSIGKKNRGDNTIRTFYMGVEHDMTGSSTSTGRYRIAITHQANSNTINLKYKKDNGSTLDFSYSETFTAAPNDFLEVGHAQNSSYSAPPGTVTKLEIYKTVLDSATINAFFA